MVQMPDLSPEWPPSTDQLAAIVNAAHWQLEELGYDLFHRPHVTRGGRIPSVADDLEHLVRLLRQHDKAWLSGYRQGDNGGL